MKLILILLLVLISQPSYSQNDVYTDELIKLAKIYKEYHTSEPADTIFQQLDSMNSSELIGAKTFIKELIQKNNNIADDEYISKPDSSTLWNLYLIRGLTWNMFNSQFGGVKKKEFGIDSLFAESIDYYEQFANYYSMLYTSILNKNRPLDISKINFDLNKYNFANDTEKGIFFLESMETLGTLISGYFYIEPPNFEKAISIINNYPTFNSESYYKYTDLEIVDFDFTYSGKDPKGSYKEYQLKKLMNTIIFHSICLSQTPETQSRMQDIFGNSILIEREYWKYCELPQVLEQIYGK